MRQRLPGEADFAEKKGFGEEGMPCLGDASVSSASSPLHSTLRRGRTEPSPEPQTKLCFKVDRANFGIFLLLFLLLLGIVAVVFFAVGQWAALSAHHSLLSHNATRAAAKTGVGRMAAETTEADLMRIWEEHDVAETETPIRRLPTTILPSRYDLHLNLTRLESDQLLSGSVRILIKCVNATKIIAFHAAKVLQVENPVLRHAVSNDIIPWSQLRRIPESSSFEIETRDFLLPDGRYVLSMDFSSPVCQKGGFTFCSRDRVPPSLPPQLANGRRMARREEASGPLWLVTKLEPAGAKWIFPCWDEPGLKAVFSVALTHDPDITALTNAAPVHSRRIGGVVRTQHRETPPMSTFLFALAFGRMASVEKDSRSGVKVQVWTRPQDIAKTEFALSYGVSMLDQLENYFVTRYPLRKLDFVAAKTYPVGAMENWGLIIFHQDMILSHPYESAPVFELHMRLHEYQLACMIEALESGSGEGDEEGETEGGVASSVGAVSAFAHRYRCSKIITHELLHQWFGNLVTMHWWSDLWLSEGLTTFFVYHFVKPDFPLLAEYEQTLMLDRVWRAQAAGEKFALVQSFTSDEAVLRSFNILHLYTKALASRLLWDLLGEATLRSGLVDYLRSNAYSSVERADLWTFLGAVAHFAGRPVDIGRVMEPWVANPGFPALHVARSGTAISLTQAPADVQASKAYENGSKNSSRLLWAIPFHYVALAPVGSWGGDAASTPRHPFWLHNASSAFADLDLRPDAAILVNPAMQFPFRVNYDLDNWARLIARLHATPEAVPEASRVQLLLDAELFLQGTDEGVVHFYDLLEYLKGEHSLIPLLTGLDLVYDGISAYRATRIFPLLLVLLRRVVQQMEMARKRSLGILEEEAVWSFERRRLASFHLLRCAGALPECAIERPEVEAFLHHRRPLGGERMAALCHFLFREARVSDNLALLASLEQEAGKPNADMQIVLASACTRDSTVNEAGIHRVVNHPNAGLMALVLGSKILVYNRGFRENLWAAVHRLDGTRRLALFNRRALAKICLESVGTQKELGMAAKSVPGLRVLKRRVRRRLRWQEITATPRLEQWLFKKLKI